MAYSENGIRIAPFESFKEHHERAHSESPYNEDFIDRCRAKALEYNDEPFIGVSLLHELKLAVPVHCRTKVLNGTKCLYAYEQHLKEIGLRV